MIITEGHSTPRLSQIVLQPVHKAKKMMVPNCYIHCHNHAFDRTDISMRLLGVTQGKPVIIEDDVWIGRNVTIMVGRHIAKGSIIAANCVLTKDFPEYSIVGGNPGKLIRSRIQ